SRRALAAPGPRRRARRARAPRRRAGSDRARARRAYPRWRTARRESEPFRARSRSLAFALAGARLAQDLLAHLLPLRGELLQPLLDAVVHGADREAPARVAYAGRDSGHQRDRIVDGRDRIHVEQVRAHGLDDVLAKHQVLHIVLRNEHAVLAGQPAPLARIEEALDFLVDAADDLHLPVLVHRARDGERLLDRQLGKRRQQRARLRDGRAVALDAAVALLEYEARVHGQLRLRGIARAEVCGQDQHALRVDRAAELDLAFDVDDLAVADPHVRRDPGRLAEMESAEAEDREPVDLPDLLARSVDQQVVPLDLL